MRSMSEVAENTVNGFTTEFLRSRGPHVVTRQVRPPRVPGSGYPSSDGDAWITA